MGIAINTPGQKPDLRTLIILGACAALATLLSSCSPNNTVAYNQKGPSSPYAGAAIVNSGSSKPKATYSWMQSRPDYKSPKRK